MRILLDTHIFLWFISGDEHIPNGMKLSICNPENDIYLSVVSFWEAIIKYQLGRLPLPQSPEDYLPIQRERHQISSLFLDEASVSQLVKLPQIHRDPFDRMLICQAITHDMILATVDETIFRYPVSILNRQQIL